MFEGLLDHVLGFGDLTGQQHQLPHNAAPGPHVQGIESASLGRAWTGSVVPLRLARTLSTVRTRILWRVAPE